MGRLDLADSLLSESIEMVAETVGEEGEDFARQLNEFAILAYLSADYEAASERFGRALAIFEKELGPTHPISLTVANNLATVQTMTGQLEEALETYRTVMERRKEVLGDRHEDVAFSYNSIGSVLCRLGRPEESIPMHLEALERYLEIYGEDHNRVAQTRTYLGNAYRDAGRTDEALAQYREALAYREANLPANHRDLIDTRISLGYAQLQAEDWARAVATLETVEQEMAASSDASPHWLFSARAAKGLGLARLGRVEEGRALTAAACDTLLAEFGPEDTTTRRAMGYLEQIDR
jgi:tetratricopeptide (TPR) repeat protein